MHEAMFANAAFAEGATVLRLALRPYSIGNEILLWKTANPLVTYSPEIFKELDESIQRQNLFAAVFICERTWMENRRPFKWINLTRFFRGDCSTMVEVEKFQTYRTAGDDDFPTVRQPKVAGAPFHYFGSPQIARLILFVSAGMLHRTLGFETPFDVPMALARQLYSTHAESQGNIWVKNYLDAENERRVKEFEAINPDSTLAVGYKAVKASAEKWNAEFPDTPVPLPELPQGGNHA